jgi:voltage-gated potassium channel
MDPARRQLDRERWRLLHQLVRALEPIVTLLGLVWLVLLVIDFTRGLPASLHWTSNTIWGIFALDFIAEFAIAPRKITYLKRHWLVALSLAVPAVRFLRFARVTRLARFARSFRDVRLARTISSLNRAIVALRSTFRRRGVSYVVVTTIAVTLGGAAAMYAFENPVHDPAGIHDYATALWWTAMIMTTMGSAYWPETGDGRILCVLLALYAFAVFGYLTATLASYFIDRDADRSDGPVAGSREIEALRREVQALRETLTTRE